MTTEKLKSMLDWVKNNWILLVVVGVVTIVAVGQNMANRRMIDLLQEENEAEFARHTADLEAMRTAYEHERAEQQAINERYRTEIERLNSEYTERLAELETRISVRRQRFITETGGRPDEMASRLRDRLGWGSEP